MLLPPPGSLKRRRLEPNPRSRPDHSAWRSLDSGPMRRLLVANRGEIALRIFRACRTEGIATVAVAAPDDAGSLHAGRRTRVVEIRCYLDAAEHVRAARESGPTPSTPATASSPRAPTSPRPSRGRADLGRPAAGGAAHGRRQARGEGDSARGGRPRAPERDAGGDRLPAARQGGGRRRRPRDAGRARAEELDEALAAARREAASAFGDDTVFFERYLERPRHVEIQLLADAHGTVLALGERDCSVQRRHQKVLEEAPSPALDAELRARMSDAAVALRARDRLPERRHGRVRPRRPRLLLPRAERADPGRASGDRARDRRRPRARAAADRVRRAARPRHGRTCAGTRSRCGSTPRTRARSCRGPAGSSGCGCPRDPCRERRRRGRRDRHGLRPDDREADRARRRPGTRRWPACATRSRRPRSPASRRTSRSCAGSSRTRALRAGDTTTAFLADHPPLSSRRLRRPEALARPLPPQPPLRRRRSLRPTSTRLRTRPAPRATSTDHGADARHGDPRPRRARRPRRGAADARRARGDEDGDAARLAVRRVVHAVHAARATGSRAARCSSSSRSSGRGGSPRCGHVPGGGGTAASSPTRLATT